jgi:hypothetical protein
MGKFKGFSHRTAGRVGKTPFLDLPSSDLEWRSPLYLSDIVRDVLEFGNDTPMPEDRELKYALRKVRDIFRLPNRAKMLHLNDMFQTDLDIWDKSPGFPWRDLGYETKGDIKRDVDAVRSVRKFWHIVKDGEDPKAPNCMAFARTHIGKRKVRVIWEYPATITFGEAVFVHPLIEAYSELDLHCRPVAYGLETANAGMKEIYNRFSGYDHYAALNFKSFDKTVPVWLINFAFDILLENLDLCSYQHYGVTNARKMLTMYYYIQRYFIQTTIRISNGNRYHKSSGIANGSYFSQLIGSICNAVLINWLSLKIDGAFPHDAIYLRDDSLVASKSTWSIEVCQQLILQVGMQLNMEKSQLMQ